MTKTILALDLGLHTGWALYQNGKIRSGTVELKPSRFESQNRRFLRFKKWLAEINDSDFMGISLVFFEAVRAHSATDAAHAYGGFMATLTTFCEELEIDYQGVPVQTIKKFISTKGNAEKSEVIKCVQKLGFNPKDDNEADAIALLLYGLSEEKITIVK